MKLLTFKEACWRLSVSRATLYRMIERGEFPKPVHISNGCPRFNEQDIDEYIASKFKS